MAGTRGQGERAATLFAAAEVLREAIGVPVPPFIRGTLERHIADTHALLGGERFRELWARGRRLALDAAVAYALETG